MAGKYPPGERLPIEKIAKAMGVSQTPVLSAIVVLEQEGLIVSRPHRSAFVRDYSDEELTVLLRVISVNEGLAASIAAELIAPREIRSLWGLHQKAVANSNLSTKEFQEYDRKFHMKIVHSCRVDLLIDLIETRLAQFYLSRYYVGRSPERIKKSLAEHNKIISALEHHDPIQAEQAIKEHIESAIRDLLFPIQAGEQSGSS